MQQPGSGLQLEGSSDGVRDCVLQHQCSRCGGRGRYLQKQIEGTIVLDGREITVLSEYGAKSAPDHLGAFVDHNTQELVARKLLSELARDAAKDH
jgi:hypothetical protein